MGRLRTWKPDWCGFCRLKNSKVLDKVKFFPVLVSHPQPISRNVKYSNSAKIPTHSFKMSVKVVLKFFFCFVYYNKINFYVIGEKRNSYFCQKTTTCLKVRSIVSTCRCGRFFDLNNYFSLKTFSFIKFCFSFRIISSLYGHCNSNFYVDIVIEFRAYTFCNNIFEKNLSNFLNV